MYGVGDEVMFKCETGGMAHHVTVNKYSTGVVLYFRQSTPQIPTCHSSVKGVAKRNGARTVWIKSPGSNRFDQQLNMLQLYYLATVKDATLAEALAHGPPKVGHLAGWVCQKARPRRSLKKSIPRTRQHVVFNSMTTNSVSRWRFRPRLHLPRCRRKAPIMARALVQATCTFASIYLREYY